MRVTAILVFLLLIIGPLHAQRTYGIKGDKNEIHIGASTKISKEMAQQVKMRDGYAADDGKVVVTMIIPPQLGGLADFNNLGALPKREAKQRRKLEKAVLKKVKKGEMSIGQARARMVYFQASGQQ